MSKALELAGKSFGLLTVLKLAPEAKRRSWSCACKCGNEKIVAQRELVRGETKSCGCLRSLLRSVSNTTHGMTGTKAYTKWQSMMGRTRHPDSKSKCYEGIKVCRRWHKFENFYADMGDPPEGYSLERKNGKKGYSKGNCVWIPLHEQAHNTSRSRYVIHNGKKLHVSAAARAVGLTPDVVLDRINKLGWSIHDALNTPLLRR